MGLHNLHIASVRTASYDVPNVLATRTTELTCFGCKVSDIDDRRLLCYSLVRLLVRSPRLLVRRYFNKVTDRQMDRQTRKCASFLTKRKRSKTPERCDVFQGCSRKEIRRKFGDGKREGPTGCCSLSWRCL